MDILWIRGQQIRVFGGFHKVAMDKGYIVWRPHYHPILDEPIIEDENLWDDAQNFKEKGYKNIMDYILENTSEKGKSLKKPR